ALVSVSVVKRASLKALRRARRLTVTVRAAKGARVTVDGKLGAKLIGKVSKRSRGAAMTLRLPLDARGLRRAKAGSTLTVRVAAASCARLSMVGLYVTPIAQAAARASDPEPPLPALTTPQLTFPQYEPPKAEPAANPPAEDPAKQPKAQPKPAEDQPAPDSQAR